MLALTALCPTGLRRLLEWKPLIILGLGSYSVYVWQELFVVLTPFGRPLDLMLQLLLLAAVSAFSYLAIERPLIQFGRKIEKKTIASEPLSVA